MTRDQWTDRLSEYLDGELGIAERAALEAHLAGCPACEVILAELRRVVARAQALDDQPPTTDLVGWEKTRAKYDVAVAELESALEQGRKSGRLDSATVRVLAQSLVTIDSAIVQARRALAADPGSVYLNQHLADTMRRKLELLRRASARAPPRT